MESPLPFSSQGQEALRTSTRRADETGVVGDLLVTSTYIHSCSSAPESFTSLFIPTLDLLTLPFSAAW